MKHKNKREFLDETENLSLQGFRISYSRVALSVLGILMSCSVLWVWMSWRKSFFMRCTHVPCRLEKAERILLVDSYGQEFVSNVERTFQGTFFYYKRIKYRWNEKRSQFENVGGLKVSTCSQLHESAEGLSNSEALKKLEVYGPNSIHIKVKPVVKLLLRELRNPFYVYQAFIVVVWCLQMYYQFAICIVILSVVSVSSTVWETRKQSRSLRDAMHAKSIVTVLRDGKESQKPSEELVPGDVLVLSRSTSIMPCDAILLSGSCVVNESMLTGESIPITKVPIPDDPNLVFDVLNQKRSVLSCGTKVLLSRSTDESDVKAIVYRTGFSTAKGELVRAILYPKPVKLKLYSDLLKCMIMFFILGIPSLIYTIIVGVKLNLHVEDNIIFVLNVCTFFVPPSLPAVLTSINQQAQKRLRQQGIFCLNTRYINMSAVLDVVCFDKTGTLTEDNLDILEIVPVHFGKFDSLANITPLSHEMVMKSLATCHSLSKIDGHLLGHDLDIKMFEASKWDLQEPSSKESVPFEYIPQRIVSSSHSASLKSVAIVRQFPFESSLKRMCVVTQTEDSKLFEVFLKGAPELVASICKKETVPDDMNEVLKRYTSEGFRVIAHATKVLPEGTTWKEVLELQREEFEAEMQFLGLIVLENRLKQETIPALFVLKEANIRAVMVTGDNLLTAITVGKKCGIMDELDKVVILEATLILQPYTRLQVNYTTVCPSVTNGEIRVASNKCETYVPVEHNEKCHIALEGTTFNLLRLYDPQLLQKVVVRGAIFARMSPEHKLYLIENFQDLGYQVGMCGDGANDCGALKTAHTGVSLSMAEASVAAPFTSTRQNIQCVPTLIREGRATLASTFDSFRYMVCYTLCFLLAVLFLFWDGQRPSDGAYIVIDIILNLTPPFLFGTTTACPTLGKKKPLRSILSFVPLFSVASFILIQIGVHAFAYSYCVAQSWFVPFHLDRDAVHSPEASFSGTTVLGVNMMCYITAAAIFATGPPFRNGFFSNKLYVAVLVTEFILVSYLCLYPPQFMVYFLNLKRAPVPTYHLTLYALSLSIFVVCLVYEKLFVQRFLSDYVMEKIQHRRGPVRKYEKLLKKLCDDNWPPI